MRAPPIDGEYPIRFSHAGNLGDDDDSIEMASTFVEACEGTTDPFAERDRAPPE